VAKMLEKHVIKWN